MSRRWRRVLLAAECPECPDCGEPVCKKHGQHYACCPCPGPTEDDLEYKVVNGVMYAIEKKGSEWRHGA